MKIECDPQQSPMALADAIFEDSINQLEVTRSSLQLPVTSYYYWREGELHREHERSIAFGELICSVGKFGPKSKPSMAWYNHCVFNRITDAVIADGVFDELWDCLAPARELLYESSELSEIQDRLRLCETV